PCPRTSAEKECAPFFMRLPKNPWRQSISLCLATTVFSFWGCVPSEPEIAPPPPKKPQTEVNLTLFKGEPIGRDIGDRRPWVSHMRAVDLDQDGLLDVVACEAKESTVSWLRQKQDGSFEEIVIATNAQ